MDHFSRNIQHVGGSSGHHPSGVASVSKETDALPPQPDANPLEDDDGHDPLCRTQRHVVLLHAQVIQLYLAEDIRMQGVTLVAFYGERDIYNDYIAKSQRIAKQ